MSNKTKQKQNRYTNQPAGKSASLESFEPVRFSTKTEPVEEEREPLFYIDDVEYTIPKDIKPNIALKYLNNLKNEGTEYAIAVAMEDILGPETMEVLAELDSATKEQMKQVMGLVQHKMIGATESIAGN